MASLFVPPLSRQPPGFAPITVDDWFEMPDAPDRYELSEGMLVMLPTPDGRHQDIAGVIHHSLMRVAMANGGWAMPALTGVALTHDIGYLPDVLYLSPERMALKTHRGVEGAPNIVVDVVSPRSRRYDLERKRPTYLASGVNEVWIVDPDVETITVHREFEGPTTARFGEPIPSRIVEVGSAFLDQLPPFSDD